MGQAPTALGQSLASDSATERETDAARANERMHTSASLDVKRSVEQTGPAVLLAMAAS